MSFNKLIILLSVNFFYFSANLVIAQEIVLPKKIENKLELFDKNKTKQNTQSNIISAKNYDISLDIQVIDTQLIEPSEMFYQLVPDIDSELEFNYEFLTSLEEL